MTLTNSNIYDRVLNRLPNAGAPYIDGPEIETWIPEGLFRVAVKNIDAPEFQKKLMGQTITAGLLTISDTTIDMKTIPWGRVSVGTVPAFYAPSYDALRTAALGSDSYWYSIEGSTLQFRNTDGTLGSLSSSATIVAVATPALSALPARFEPVMIEEMVSIANEQIAKKQETG